MSKLPTDVDALARGRSASMFDSLQYPAFRRLFISNLAYFFGMMGQVTLRMILAWKLTESALSLSYLSLALGLSMFLMAPLGGVIADRMDRRLMVIAGQAIILANCSVVYVLLTMDVLVFWHVVLSTVITGLVFPMTGPARNAMIAGLVPRQSLNNAMALSAGSMNVGKVVGPAGVGLMIPLVGLEHTFLATLIIYFVGLVTLFRLPKSTTQSNKKGTTFGNMLDGMRYLKSDPSLFLVFLLGLLPALIGLPYQTLLVMFAEEIWQVGESGYGFLQGACGLGAVLGTVIIARQGRTVSTKSTLLLGLGGFALFLTAFALSPNIWVALPLAMIANTFANIAVVKNNITVQLLTSDEMRGRMSSVAFITIALTPLGSVPLAIFAENYGPVAAVVCAGVLLGVLAILFFALSKTLRNLDQVVRDSN